jgi:hypothetical protein
MLAALVSKAFVEFTNGIQLSQLPLEFISAGSLCALHAIYAAYREPFTISDVVA